VPAIIAIGYPSEATASLAAEEARALAADLLVEPDAIAEVVRDKEGAFKVTSNHHAVAGGPTYGMFWGLLFGVLFFVPVLGLAVGAALGALMGVVTKLELSDEFQRQVRDLLQPGTSALFMIVEKMTTDKALAALSQFGGTVLKTSLSKEAEEEIQQALHGSPQAATVSTPR
jgi:uncharacterized membrane protein